MTVRIAMWSGPRNLSTAMMRAFGARGDCAVWDEPFYAAYLARTGKDHPMRAQILTAHETDPAVIAARCAGEAPGGKPLFYQKHMTHHMVDGFDTAWMGAVKSAFLIREPLFVAASYEAKWEEPSLDELGFARQAELFRAEADRLGHAPPVIDAARIAAAPQDALVALCAGLGIRFDPAMLSWPSGARSEDGVWGAHWYGAVNASTGFAPPRDAPALATPHARKLADAARPYYDELRPHAL